MKKYMYVIVSPKVHYIEFIRLHYNVFYFFIGHKYIPTTTPIPTTTINVPVPGKNDSAEITVFLGGRKPVEFKDPKLFDELRGMIANMTIRYCGENNFDLVENIT